MKILIDADGCPVVDITVSIAKENGIECIILCDTSHEINRDGVKTMIISKGADSVDFALVNMLDNGDIAVTQDYGLAAMCLAKGAYALSQNGMVYSNSNIDSLLFQRYTAKKIRMAGGHAKKIPKRTHEQDEKFISSLKELVKMKS